MAAFSTNLRDRKCTGGMREHLDKLAELLKCPLCDKIFEKPTTLASCAHSFCVACIDSYCCDAWVCPVEGCRMPMSITGGHKGSYRKINPQLAQTVESLKTICNNLNQAPDEWWKSECVTALVTSARADDLDDPLDEKEEANRDNDEEDMVDLQRHESPVLEESSIDDEDEADDNDWD
mmetsp:Transcript_89272/g.133846  ORF Transcript_89272/g.133846 Transcript_89272/m.133846 type:complete len:178 (-) Transcript_89272:242-775(-)